MNFGILFLIFSSLLICNLVSVHHCLASQFPWNNFCQQSKLIVGKSKEYFSPCLQWPPSTAFDSEKCPSFHLSHSWLHWHHPSGRRLITPSQSPCKCFFPILIPLELLLKVILKIFFSFSPVNIISLMTSSMTVTAFSLLKDFLTSPSRLWSLSWAPEL